MTLKEWLEIIVPATASLAAAGIAAFWGASKGVRQHRATVLWDRKNEAHQIVLNAAHDLDVWAGEQATWLREGWATKNEEIQKRYEDAEAALQRLIRIRDINLDLSNDAIQILEKFIRKAGRAMGEFAEIVAIEERAKCCDRIQDVYRDFLEKFREETQKQIN